MRSGWGSGADAGDPRRRRRARHPRPHRAPPRARGLPVPDGRERTRRAARGGRPPPPPPRARAGAAAPRPGAGATPVLAAGPLTLDVARHTVTLEGRALALTPKEFDLLQVLLESAGRVLSREHLLDRGGGSARGDEIEARTGDVHV